MLGYIPFKDYKTDLFCKIQPNLAMAFGLQEINSKLHDIYIALKDVLMNRLRADFCVVTATMQESARNLSNEITLHNTVKLKK